MRRTWSTSGSWRWVTRARLRIRSLVRAEAVEQELQDELRDHLEREIAHGLDAGLTAEDARRAARRAMGATASRLEECRDARGVSLVQHALRDTRFSLRQLIKAPVFAGTAIFVLALSLAATVAIFAFVDAVLLRPLPYADQAALLDVFTVTEGGSRGLVSYLDATEWQRRNQVFRDAAAYDVRAGFTMRTDEGPARVTGLRVTPGFFRTLGISPAVGRDFRDGEDAPSAAPPVVVSHAAWQTRFNGRADVLGQVVVLDGEPHTVVGILPPSFYFPAAGQGEFWTTIRGTNACWKVRGCQSVQVIARLRDGVTIDRAIADLQRVQRQIRADYPDANPRLTAGARFLRDTMVGDVRPILLVLLSGAGLLLLIAGINVMSLLLARSVRRTRELAVRRALGATAGRLLLQFASESLVLVAMSTLVGLVGARWALRFLTSLISTEMLNGRPYLQTLDVTARAAIVAGAIAVVATVLFTVVPALFVSRAGRFDGLQDGARGSAGRLWRRFGVHLVVAELAMAVVLLVGAGLLGKSLSRMLHEDIGLASDRLVTQSVGLASGTLGAVKGEEVERLGRSIVDRLAALPGVDAVGFADLLPLSPGGAWPPVTSAFDVEGRPAQAQRYTATVRSVSAGYLPALQARLVRGRQLADADTASTPRVAIINQTMADQLFAGEDPLGRRIVRAGPAMEIVGVVADVQEGSLETPARPAVYAPFAQWPNSHFALAVRTSQDARALLRSLPAAIREVRSDLLLTGGATMDERIARLPSAYLTRSSAWLVGSFATIALLLSVVGLYGVVSYSVSQRTREMGVRLALGAPASTLYRLVLGEAARLVALGTALGLIASVAAARLMRGLLFGVQAWDVPTLTAVSVLLTTCAIAAAYVPARRAAAIDPIEVLRAE